MSPSKPNKTDSTDPRISANQKKWEEIQRLRKQSRRQTRNRRIVIVAGALVILALVATMVAMLVKPNSQNSASKQITGATLTESGNKVSEVNGFAIGSNGLGSANPSVPNVELYYSYSCPGCIQFEHEYGQQLLKMAKENKINFVLHPVNVHTLPWTLIASEAAIKVGEEQPDKFIQFHTALFDTAYQIMFKDEASIQAQGNGSDLANPTASLELVKKAAKKAGVKQNLIDQFKADGAATTPNKWTDNWVSELKKKLPNEQPATPLLLHNGKTVDTTKLVKDNKIDLSILEKPEL